MLMPDFMEISKAIKRREPQAANEMLPMVCDELPPPGWAVS
jgi:hypothetical protein